MKTGVKRESKKKSWVVPGEPLSKAEFKKGIKTAEKGPFHSIEKSRKIVSQWRKQSTSR